MSTIAIAAIGSRGDVAPLTGVGQRLQQAGHDVVVAALSPLAAMVTGCGLRFREIPVDFVPGTDLPESPARSFVSIFGPAGMLDMGRAIHSALLDEPADILLLSPLSELAGHPLAEAKAIPSIGMRQQPISATSLYPPTVMGGWSAGAKGNRFASDAGAWTMDHFYARVIADLRRDLGLPKTSPTRLRRARTQRQWPVLHGYSPQILPRPSDWRPGLEVTGYWWPATVPDWEPPASLVDFLSAGPAPVFLGFGSATPTAARVAQLSDIVGQALRLAGVRGVVQSGWAGLQVSGDEVLTIGEVPHEWLFPKMAAVAHHCGAGTTAATLRAGIPHLALPGPAGDQPFWARRLEHLRVSAATIPQRHLTAERLADAMRAAIRDNRLRDNAAQLSRTLAGEDGVAAVLRTVETHMPTPP